MIIRCTQCQSAFAVDDAKVENRKFAFTCPKCDTSNIIDNRLVEATAPAARVREEAVEEPVAARAPRREEAVPVKTTSRAERAPEADEDFLDAAFEEEASPAVDKAKTVGVDDFDDLDLGEFDLSDDAGTATPAAGKKAIKQDEEIDLAELGLSEDEELSALIEEDVAGPGVAPAAKREPGEDLASELDDLESALRHEESLHDLEPMEEDLSFEEPKKGASKIAAADYADDDLDDLILDEDRPAKTGVKGDKVFAKDQGDTDESITIDLDSLDIQLEEDQEVHAAAMPDEDGELPELTDMEMEELAAADKGGGDADESITIDLDSLDIPLEEEPELKQGEILDEDETLTIDDAGLTMDELEAHAPAAKGARHAVEDHDAFDEDETLRLDDIEHGLEVDELHAREPEGDRLLTEEIGQEELPEIDFDKFESVEPSAKRAAIPAVGMGVAAGAGRTEGAKRERAADRGSAYDADDILDIEKKEDFARYQEDLDRDERQPSDTVPRGAVNFSIDYSLGFTRTGAALRLFFLFYLRLVPHYVVSLVYMLLSGVCGFINWLIILFTGESSEDFTGVQEKTIRALLSLNACAADVVEDVPEFAGKKNIDYPLQYDVTYPVTYSKLLAFLRLTGIGIFIITLPHLLILFILSVGSMLIGLVGLVSVIATRRWPNVLFDFMIRYYRYESNVLSFVFGLVDKYPTFRFE